MAITSTAVTDFDKTIATLIRKQLEDELLPSLPHLMPGHFIKATFVKGTNSTMRFLRVPFLTSTINSGTVTPGTAPWLTEGVAPAALALAIGSEEFSAYQCGRRIALTDVAMQESSLELASLASDRVARDAAETADMYVANALVQGTNVLYAGTGNTQTSEVAAGDVVTSAIVRRVAQTMKADSIPTFGDRTYHAIVHPGVVFDFEGDTAAGSWLAVGQYQNAGNIENGEIGKYAGVKFFESPSAVVKTAQGTSSCDVYSTIFLGPDAYAFGDWGKITTHYVAPGGHGDELAQVASVGWKGWLGAMLVDGAGARYLRVESGSAL